MKGIFPAFHRTPGVHILQILEGEFFQKIRKKTYPKLVFSSLDSKISVKFGEGFQNDGGNFFKPVEEYTPLV